MAWAQRYTEEARGEGLLHEVPGGAGNCQGKDGDHEEWPGRDGREMSRVRHSYVSPRQDSVARKRGNAKPWRHAQLSCSQGLSPS